MTVKDLIEKLSEFDENMEVYVNDNLGASFPEIESISIKEFIDGKKFVEIE